GEIVSPDDAPGLRAGAGFAGADRAGAEFAGAAGAALVDVVSVGAAGAAGRVGVSTGGPVGMSAANPRPSPPLRVALMRPPDSRVIRVPPTHARRPGSSSRRAILDRSRELSFRSPELRRP